LATVLRPAAAIGFPLVTQFRLAAETSLHPLTTNSNLFDRLLHCGL
jgi:hypothetical protein